MSQVTTLVLVSVGNTRTRIAIAKGPGGEFAKAVVEPSVVVENAAAGSLESAVRAAADGLDASRSQVLVASVNDALLPRITAALGGLGRGGGTSGLAITRLGNGSGGTVRVPVVMDVQGSGSTVGVDRLLCALAASARSGGAACAVIDAGTCVTVDFVDAHAVFQGGAIAPGVGLMLKSMHGGTSALPSVLPPRKGDDTAWITTDEVKGAMGKNTEQAMLLGTLNAVRGLVRWQVEKFAEAAGSYPRVIATGGDAPLLFDPRIAGAGDDLVEHIVPDLQLVGMVAAWTLLQGNSAAGGDEALDEFGREDEGDGE
ncbi:MAG: type III pantothenate kinase [Phycisphaerales bacterium]|nr:type III pantothenate kinase [Phycisphaerales bacterium]